MTNRETERPAGGEAGALRGLVVAVVGSRRIVTDRALCARLAALREAGELAEVVSGGAAGVDSIAAEWARTNGVKLTELRPDYEQHGAQAPHIRNAEIVKRAELVLVVWDGESRGTLSAARHAQRLGRPCEWLLARAPADLAPKARTGGSSSGGSSSGGAAAPGGAGQLGLF